MKVIALYSLKGGVGKTASAVNLAYLCAQAGHRTLLWDLDPQGAASFHLRIKPKLAGGPRGLFKHKATRFVKQKSGSSKPRLGRNVLSRKSTLILRETNLTEPKC